MRLIVASLFLLIIGCRTAGLHTGHTSEPVAVAQLPAAVETAAREADQATHRAAKLAAGAHGMELGSRCIRHHPHEARCYYYRAMATGRYFEAKVIGYQRGVKQMIDDLRQVIARDPDFDHAGAYRMLGQLYTQLPRSTIHPHDITRDLEAARHLLTTATTRAPEFPENHLALCEALLEAEDRAEAVTTCQRAFQLATRWDGTTERQAWAPTIAQLKKRLAK